MDKTSRDLVTNISTLIIHDSGDFSTTIRRYANERSFFYGILGKIEHLTDVREKSNKSFVPMFLHSWLSISSWLIRFRICTSSVKAASFHSVVGSRISKATEAWKYSSTHFHFRSRSGFYFQWRDSVFLFFSLWKNMILIIFIVSNHFSFDMYTDKMHPTSCLNYSNTYCF